MKKILLTAAVLAMALMSVPAHADGDFVAEGHILIGDLFSPVGSLTQDCTGDTNGVDTFTVALPEGSGGAAITATADGDINDVDLYFYDAGCNFLDESLAAAGDESGEVPADAAFVEADLFIGANANIVITVSAA